MSISPGTWRSPSPSSSRAVHCGIDDFTRGASELSFCYPERLPEWPAELSGGAAPVKGSMLECGAAHLWLCEEGEEVGFLLWSWLKRVTVRRADRSVLFTIRRTTALTSTATVVGPGATLARIRRSGRTYRGGLTELSQAASGVLTGPHGDIIVRDVPVDRELIHFKFGTGATPEIRAVMFGIALLYEHDFRG